MMIPDNHHVECAKRYVHSLMSDKRGQSGAGDGVNMVLGLFVTLLVAVYLVPVAMNQINSVTTTSWSSGATELWGLLGLAIVLSIVLFMIQSAASQAENAGR